MFLEENGTLAKTAFPTFILQANLGLPGCMDGGRRLEPELGALALEASVKAAPFPQLILPTVLPVSRPLTRILPCKQRAQPG